MIRRSGKTNPPRWKEMEWAWYVGGMRDDGDWNFENMIRAEVEELTRCLTTLELQRERRNATAKEPQVPLEEWFAKAKEDVIWESLLEHAKAQKMAFFSGKPPTVRQPD